MIPENPRVSASLPASLVLGHVCWYRGGSEKGTRQPDREDIEDGFLGSWGLPGPRAGRESGQETVSSLLSPFAPLSPFFFFPARRGVGQAMDCILPYRATVPRHQTRDRAILARQSARPTLLEQTFDPYSSLRRERG